MSEVESKIKADSFEPDYELECDVCGNTPVVDVVKDSKVIHTTGMCGPCTFGTAKALNPNWWNGDDD